MVNKKLSLMTILWMLTNNFSYLLLWNTLVVPSVLSLLFPKLSLFRNRLTFDNFHSPRNHISTNIYSSNTSDIEDAMKAKAFDLLDCLTCPINPDDVKYDIEKDIRRDNLLLTNDYYDLKLELKSRGLRTTGDKAEMMIRLLLHTIDPTMQYNEMSGREPNLKFVDEDDIKAQKVNIVPLSERAVDDGPDAEDLAVLRQNNSISASKNPQEQMILDGLMRKEISIPLISLTDSVLTSTTSIMTSPLISSEDFSTVTTASGTNISAYIVGGRDVLGYWETSSTVVILIPDDAGWKDKRNRIIADEIAFANQNIVIIPDVHYFNSIYSKYLPSSTTNTTTTSTQKKSKKVKSSSLPSLPLSNLEIHWKYLYFDIILSTLHYCKQKYGTKCTLGLAGSGSGGGIALDTMAVFDSLAMAAKTYHLISSSSSSSTGTVEIGVDGVSFIRSESDNNSLKTVKGSEEEEEEEEEEGEDNIDLDLIEFDSINNRLNENEGNNSNNQITSSELYFIKDNMNSNSDASYSSNSEYYVNADDDKKKKKKNKNKKREDDDDDVEMFRMFEEFETNNNNNNNGMSSDSRHHHPSLVTDTNSELQRLVTLLLTLPTTSTTTYGNEENQSQMSSPLLTFPQLLELHPQAVLALCPSQYDPKIVSQSMTSPVFAVFGELDDATGASSTDANKLYDEIIRNYENMDNICFRIYEGRTTGFTHSKLSKDPLDTVCNQDALSLGAIWLDIFCRSNQIKSVNTIVNSNSKINRQSRLSSLQIVPMTAMKKMKIQESAVAKYLHDDPNLFNNQ